MALSLKTKEHILRAAALLVPKWGALLGGGAALLKRNVSAADGLCRPVILDDVSLNAIGYERLAERLTKNDEQ